MSSRADSVAFRGWVAAGGALLGLAVPMALNAVGLSVWPVNADPYSPADRGLWDRIGLVSETMLPSCLVVFAAARWRVSSDAMLVGEENRGGQLLPAVFGVLGAVLFWYQWAHWGPYTGKPFVLFDGWQFVVAWILLWWGFVFFRGFGQDRRTDRPSVSIPPP